VFVEGSLVGLIRPSERVRTEHFQRYHRLLNRAVWSGREASHVLLGVLVSTLVPNGPLVIGVDETLERRWGKKIPRGLARVD
jgi:hypothetical protein